MTWRRIRVWLMTLGALESSIGLHGRITMQQVLLPDGLGWQCFVRALPKPDTPSYAWKATGSTLKAALRAVLHQILDCPEVRVIEGAVYRPKLGGPEFDDD